MALKTKKSRTRKSTSKAAPKNSSNISIKGELLGLLCIAVAIFLALSLISYHPTDPVGTLDDGNIYAVKNLFGIFGASLARPLFQWTLGYPILFLPILSFLVGLFLLLKKNLSALIKPSILITVWSLFISMVIALPDALKKLGNVEDFYPSGFIGGLISSYSVKIFSDFGAIFFYVVLFIALIIVTFRFPFSELSNRMVHFIINSFAYLLSLFKWEKKKGKKTKEIVPPVEEKTENFPEPAVIVPENIAVEEAIEPGEMILPDEPESEVFEPEIVHSSIETEEEQLTATDQMEMTLNPNPQTEESTTVSSELGFEVQEAHQEKELDYDELIRDSLSKYQFPSTDILEESLEATPHLTGEELKSNARLLEESLAQFGVKASVNRVVEGPVITLYEVKPAHGVKISQIVKLADDLALAMRARGIRMIAPIPGKAAIGIEIPNRNPSIVYFRSLVRSETFINSDGKLLLGMGKTISGEIYTADLTKMPHLLIAGATGSGKSVGINTMIASLLYRMAPSDLKFVMIDPKKLELSIYAKLKDHYLATCQDLDEIVITNPQNAILVLRSVVNEMEERYDKLAAMGVREITHYNRKIEEYKNNGETSDQYRKLPFIVVVIDELADLILTATREVEEPITRLAQMARAVGIHLIVATQRPSVDILTGLIKANFPARVAYQVATRPDSKTILDMYGAEKLIGNGDMLFFPPGKMKPTRLQNPLVTTEEIDRMIKHIRKQPKFPPYELKLIRARVKNGPGSKNALEQDELFESAKEIVIRHNSGSVSLLQRKLKIGYARSARIVDELEEAGIVGPAIEGKAREVLVSTFNPEENL